MAVFVLGNFLFAQLGWRANLGQLIVLEVSALIGMRPFLTDH